MSEWKIKNFQLQVCVCAASASLPCVKPRKCRAAKAAQKWG